MKAIVIGGGIAGLTAAIAFERAGIDVEVHEAAPAVEPLGTGIGIGPNAMHVFRMLGLAGEVRARSSEIRRAGVYDRSGRPIRTLEIRSVLSEDSLLGAAIHRAELQDALLGRLAKTRVHLGREIVSFTQDRSSVTASFADGSSASGDVLIGADGIDSVVRERLHPEARLRYSGQTCWRGIADVPLQRELRNTLMEVWGAGERMGFVEIAPGRVYWFAVLRKPAGGRDDPGTLRRELDAAFGEFTPPCPEILARTDVDRIIRSDLYDLPPLRGWSDRRVCLIGDAAHATTPNLGQGGCQAVEDGLALALCLDRYREPAEAFRRFEQARFPKTSFVVRNSRGFGVMAHLRGRLVRRVRDFLIGIVPAAVQRAQFRRILDMGYLDRL